MEINLSLSQLFENAFGYKSPAFDPEFAAVTGDVIGKRKETGKFGSAYYANDAVGREYFMPVAIDVGTAMIKGTSTTYAEALGANGLNGPQDGTWRLPYPVLSAEIVVKVVDTELTEQYGMVSELINVSGYKITVRGFVINQTANEFPEDDCDTLNRLVGLKTRFAIYNPLTDLLLVPNNGQRMVTIRKFNFVERGGTKHVKPYVMELMSDVAFNLNDIS